MHKSNRQKRNRTRSVALANVVSSFSNFYVFVKQQKEKHLQKKRDNLSRVIKSGPSHSEVEKTTGGVVVVVIFQSIELIRKAAFFNINAFFFSTYSFFLSLS